MPVIFGCTLIFIVLMRYYSRKQTKINTESANELRLRELEALTARKQDISGLPYMIADNNKLPVLPDASDEEATERLTKLKQMNGKQLLNLSNISNTDLRLTYGAANFLVLSACDTDYMNYTQELYRLGHRLHETGYPTEALQVLTYALELHTDIGNTYRLLGDIYASHQDQAALSALMQQAEANLTELVLPPVLTYLKKLSSVSDHAPE
ncbi:MAG: hypothetical protein IJY09_10880 [Lachnospiraceae bacterium]|nr:hypothetical protein [Lachnospiraceae bacterium]